MLTDASNGLPVFRVLIVRIPRALVLQVGIMVSRVGVVAVLVNLIQAPDINEKYLIKVCFLFRGNMNIGPYLVAVTIQYVLLGSELATK